MAALQPVEILRLQKARGQPERLLRIKQSIMLARDGALPSDREEMGVRDGIRPRQKLERVRAIARHLDRPRQLDEHRSGTVQAAHFGR